MDREWSTSALSEGQQAWDWFSLQLSDGSSVRLSRGNVQLEVLDTWTSPRSGVRYPSRWRLAVPSVGLRLALMPRLSHQELPVSVRYWVGAVQLEGEHGRQPVVGVGYVELTGYADAAGTRERQGKGQAGPEPRIAP